MSDVMTQAATSKTRPTEDATDPTGDVVRPTDDPTGAVPQGQTSQSGQKQSTAAQPTAQPDQTALAAQLGSAASSGTPVAQNVNELNRPNPYGTATGGKSPTQYQGETPSQQANNPAAPKTKKSPTILDEKPQSFNLQTWLNQQLAPYNKQLGSIVNQVENTDTTQPWMPQSIVPAVQNLQKLTNSSLKSLMPATLQTEQSAVQSQAASQLEQLIPSALIYHTLTGNLPTLSGGNNAGNSAIQNLWKVFQNINIGSENPANATTGSITQLLQNINNPADSATGNVNNGEP